MPAEPMPAGMHAPASKEDWEFVLRDVAEKLLHTSNAGAVLVVLAQADWMERDNDLLAGIAGSPRCNTARLAQHLRDMARMVERQAANIAAGVPFEAVDDGKESSS